MDFQQEQSFSQAPNSYRSPWVRGFPEVVVHATQSARDQHPGYQSAKSGDIKASLELVNSLLSVEATARIADLVQGQQPLLAAVTAAEAIGFNTIPDAMASVLGERLKLPIDGGELRQTNRVVHTKSSGWHRFVTPAEFAGEVVAGTSYVLVDDHVGLGGTLANMRGYIERYGGIVIAMTTISETRDGRIIALQEETLNSLRSKHGEELENFWRLHFGYGLNCCTQLEAEYLCRQKSVDSIRGCLAEAAEKARQAGLPPIKFS